MPNPGIRLPVSCGLALRRAAIAAALSPAVLIIAGDLRPAHADDTIPTVVVTPDLVPTDPGKIGSSVSVITRDQIERSGAATVVDLMRGLPGVGVSESGGLGSVATVSLRGAESQHTLVLIDGVRVNDPSDARESFDFAAISLENVERIEILRGPQSALYGSDAMGGVINIITRKAGSTPHFSVSADGGSYGTRETNGSAGFTNGPFSLFAAGDYFDTDGFSRVGNRDHGEADGTEKYSGTLRAGLDGGPDGPRLDFGLDGYHQRSEYDLGPGFDLPGYDLSRDLVTAFARLTPPTVSDRLNQSLTLFSLDERTDYEEPGGVTNYHGNDSGMEYQAIIGLAEAGNLIVGGKLDHERATQDSSSLPYPVFNISRDLFAGYFLYQLPVGDRLNLGFAGRNDGEFGGDDFTTGRFTASYALPETDTRLRGSIGTGAKRPTIFELSYNPDLRPETSWGADLGFDQTLFGGATTLSVTGFYNRFNDLIDFYFTGDFNTSTYRNINAAETAGVELAATSTLLPGTLTSTVSYTYLFAENLVTNLPLQRRPTHSGKVAFTYTGVPGWETTVATTLVGSRPDNDADTVVLPPYARVDLYATYHVNPSLSIFGRVENLFDTNYEEVSGYNTAGLSAYVGLKWSN